MIVTEAINKCLGYYYYCYYYLCYRHLNHCYHHCSYHILTMQAIKELWASTCKLQNEPYNDKDNSCCHLVMMK